VILFDQGCFHCFDKGNILHTGSLACLAFPRVPCKPILYQTVSENINYSVHFVLFFTALFNNGAEAITQCPFNFYFKKMVFKELQGY